MKHAGLQRFAWLERRAAPALLLLLSTLATSAAAQELFPGRRFPMGGAGTGAGVSADFNADGWQDIATANRSSNDVSVVLGDGKGGFGAPLLMPVRGGPIGIATADFNHDGNADLATVNQDGNDVSVLLGAGDGSFGPPANYPVGDYPQDIAAADFNGDGHIDLVTADCLSTQVSVLLGEGSGGFAAAQSSSMAGYYPMNLDAGDLDADGNVDLALTVYDQNALLVSFGDGVGGFAAPTSVQPHLYVTNVTIADVDMDGTADLLATTDAFIGQVLFLGGDGSGAFTQAAPLFTVQTPRFARCFDVNADGLTDLITANRSKYSDYAGTVSLLLATAPGIFAPAAVLATGGGKAFVTAADMNGDGWLDLVAPNGGYDVTVLLASAPGSFKTALVLKPHLKYTLDFKLADLDGDGLPDIVSCGDYSILSVLKAEPGGGFEPPTLLPAAATSMRLALGDLDGDGVVDAVTCNDDGTLSVFRGDGAGSFAPAVHHPVSPGLVDVGLGDMNWDGSLDIATDDVDGKAWLLLNDGAGDFLPPASHMIGKGAQVLVVADVNADGGLDLVVLKTKPSDQTCSVTVLRGNNAGGFQPPLPTPLPPQQYAMTLGDANGDGLPDLITIGQGLLQIRPGDGSGVFGAPIFERPTTFAPVTWADVNGDGHGDLVSGAGSLVQVLLGDGAAGFAEPLSYSITTNAAVFAVGDLNADGAPDLASATNSTGEGGGSAISVLFNLSPTWAWSTLGAGLAGAHGVPTLTGSGALTVGNVVTLTLDGALENSVAALVVGLSAVNLPFKGGVLVPNADLVFVAEPTGPLGQITLASAWPAFVPPGAQLFFQHWVVDAAGVQGLSASNAAVCTSP